jgi:hypothetical protein
MRFLLALGLAVLAMLTQVHGQQTTPCYTGTSCNPGTSQPTGQTTGQASYSACGTYCLGLSTLNDVVVYDGNNCYCYQDCLPTANSTGFSIYVLSSFASDCPPPPTLDCGPLATCSGTASYTTTAADAGICIAECFTQSTTYVFPVYKNPSCSCFTTAQCPYIKDDFGTTIFPVTIFNASNACPGYPPTLPPTRVPTVRSYNGN